MENQIFTAVSEVHGLYRKKRLRNLTCVLSLLVLYKATLVHSSQKHVVDKVNPIRVRLTVCFRWFFFLYDRPCVNSGSCHAVRAVTVNSTSSTVLRTPLRMPVKYLKLSSYVPNTGALRSLIIHTQFDAAYLASAEAEWTFPKRHSRMKQKKAPQIETFEMPAVVSTRRPQHSSLGDLKRLLKIFIRF